MKPLELAARLKEERPADVWERLLEMDERLVRAGFPRMSHWWKETLARFYASGKRRLVLRVGRRGGKSSTLCRVAVAEILWGGNVVPPGDIGYWAFISVKREEAEARLVTVRAILGALGVRFTPTENGIIVEGKNLGFKTYVATVAGVSGPTLVGYTADEVAKWRDKDTGANPATQVLASLKPATATIKTAKEFWCSSPFSTIDAHAEAYDRGETADQSVARAATWEANPTISEEDTKGLEPDEPTRQREYGAVPMGAGTSNWFDSEAIKACIRPLVFPVAPQPGTLVAAGGDLAFVSDSAALVIGHTIGEWNKATFRVADMLERSPLPGQPLMPGRVVEEFATKLMAHGLDSMMADGHYKMTVVEHFYEYELSFVEAPTIVSDPFVRMRVLIHGGRAELPDHPKLLRQLRDVMYRPTQNNAIQIIQPRGKGGHGDLVSAMVLAAWQKGGIEHKLPEEKPDRSSLHEAAAARWQQRKEAIEDGGGDWLTNRYG